MQMSIPHLWNVDLLLYGRRKLGMGGEELFQVNLGGPQRKSQARGRQKETDRGRRDVLLETAWSRGGWRNP